MGKDLPVNRDTRTDAHGDKLLRDLDCATLEFMGKQIRTQYKKDISNKNHSTYKIFDSVCNAHKQLLIPFIVCLEIN
ncbi:MAG: hypothetical protein ABIW34_14660 [Ginsengibacter sp.]